MFAQWTAISGARGRIKDHMLSVRKTWLARLLATVAALALIVACIVGTYSHYSHAAGHAHHHAPQTAHAVHAEGHGPAGHAHHTGEHRQLTGVHHAGEHEHAPPGTGEASDCSDLICHGGFAVLAAAPAIPHPLGSTLVIPPVAALHSTKPSGLDRPPKASVRA